MMTRLQLRQAGIDPERDIRANYVGSQHASIMQVVSRGAAACATWPMAWITFQRGHPAEASKLEARFPTTALVNQGVVARKDVPPELARKVAGLLATMHETAEGRALLDKVPVERYALAGDREYAVVDQFLATYRAAFPGSDE
jgi:phosphonate transport system substrate-binding protein